MSDSGNQTSITMTNNLPATVTAVDFDDPILDLSKFFEEAARFSVLDYVGTFLEMSIQHMFPRPANYDDSIVADLPTFLEMATYEDPMDDLAVFYENACRWSVSLSNGPSYPADKIQ